eukprot:GEZU01019845.1.p1 GENE.GEZU01019845.1~~GEZU01019845.1.p1  ORF type:complete len:176 (+),score=64.37 GEZU01019845.1:468-995(+)
MPNAGSDGGWKPSLNICTVLTSIQLLMSEPNPDDGLMAEITEEYKNNKARFLKTAREYTLKHASEHNITANKSNTSSNNNSSSKNAATTTTIRKDRHTGDEEGDESSSEEDANNESCSDDEEGSESEEEDRDSGSGEEEDEEDNEDNNKKKRKQHPQKLPPAQANGSNKKARSTK